MHLLERNTVDGICNPVFDFCFIDGAHTWDVDGFAFFLVDKLLRDGGWILFDDLRWRLADQPDDLEKPWIKRLPEGMKQTAQVGKIFGLLVSQHPNYGELRVEGDWGWARKVTSAANTGTAHRNVLDLVYGGQGSIRHQGAALARHIVRRLLSISRHPRRS